MTPCGTPEPPIAFDRMTSPAKEDGMNVSKIRFGVGDVASLVVAVVAVFSAYFATTYAAENATERIDKIETELEARKAAQVQVIRLADALEGIKADTSKSITELRDVTRDLAKAMTSQALDGVAMRSRLEEVQRQIDRLENRGRS